MVAASTWTFSSQRFNTRAKQVKTVRPQTAFRKRPSYRELSIKNLQRSSDKLVLKIRTSKRRRLRLKIIMQLLTQQSP